MFVLIGTRTPIPDILSHPSFKRSIYPSWLLIQVHWLTTASRCVYLAI